eukprot:Hpha_TRINITY_DN9553_c0_g1::TRINITY_DN9553_c0_g1_i2::g.114999::m.114999
MTSLRGWAGCFLRALCSSPTPWNSSSCATPSGAPGLESRFCLPWGDVQSTFRHGAASLFVFCAALPPALLLSADGLAPVLALTGGVSASALAFLLPGLLYFAHLWGNDATELRTGGAVMLGAVLVGVGAWSLLWTLYSFGGASHASPPGCP